MAKQQSFADKASKKTERVLVRLLNISKVYYLKKLVIGGLMSK